MIYTILINAVAVYITALILEGVQIKGFLTAIWVAVLLALVNAFLKPFIVLLTLPLTVLTLGLFILVINALLLMLVDALVEGMKIRSFAWAVIFSVLISIVNALLLWLF